VSRNWKPAERALAKLLGGERVPVTGRARGWAPDIKHPWLALEVKTRKRMPLLLATAIDQAEKAAAWCLRRGEGARLPVAIIHQDGQHFRNSLLVMRLGDFLDNFGDGRLPEEPPAS
jgi:hypothetical protein